MRSPPSGNDDAITGKDLSLHYWEQALLDLIAIPSVTGSEGEVAEALEKHLELRFPDARVWRQPVGEGRWNILMERGTPVLTLSSHMDVVPGGPAATWTEESIVGRGACDAKGQIVAQLWGLEMAIARGVSDYRCAFVVGEETDAIGARTLLELPPTQYILNGEPTGGCFVRHSWGSTDLEISTQGESAHSSLGTDNSAIHKLIDELQRLLANQPAGLSVNVGMIRGGLAANIQAPFASCDLCVRIRDSSELLERFLNDTLKEAAWTFKSPPTHGIDLYVPEGFRQESIEVKFASDCSLYVGNYERVMLFGPGSIQEAHTDHESLSRGELRNAAERICDVVCLFEE
jgi:acetylornithine deacetylase